MELAGRTALLTGATGGLGRAIAAALAERGAKLLLSGRKAEALEALAAELPGEGHRVAARRPGRARGGGAARRRGRRGRRPRRQRRPAGDRPHGATSAAEQLKRALRVNLEAPMLLAQALCAGDARARRGPPGLHLLPFAASRRARSPPSTTRPSSACAASPSACAPTSSRRASASRSSRPGSSAKPACSPTPGAKPPPGLGTGRPEQVGEAVVRAIEREQGRDRRRPVRQRLLAHFASRQPRHRGQGRRAAAPARRRAESVASGHTTTSASRPRRPRMESMSSRLLRRPGDPRGRRAHLRDLPPRRAAGALRRRPAALLDQGPAGERAAAGGRRLGHRRRRRGDRRLGRRGRAQRRDPLPAGAGPDAGLHRRARPWSTWRRCATRWRRSAAIPRRSTRWSTSTW